MKRLLKSFLHAFRGLWFVIKNERNIQIHFIIAIVVIILALYLRISLLELILLIIIILFVIIAEFINTIVELIIDYVSPHFNQKSRIIKDLAAGMVLIISIGSVVIGLLIFYPHIKSLIK